MAWAKRHLKKVPPGWIASVGDEVEIRKVKSNPNILVRYLSEVIEMHPGEAAEYISARGEEWVPAMFRLSADHFRKYDDCTMHWAYKLALRNHERFLRDASVYDSMPHGNESYENAAYYAERYKEMAQTIKGVIDARD